MGHSSIFSLSLSFEHLSYFSKGKCVRQQPLALSRRTRPPLSRLVALLARGNTRNTPDTSPFPRWKWVAFPSFLSFLSALSTPPLVAPRPGAARRARALRVGLLVLGFLGSDRPPGCHQMVAGVGSTPLDGRGISAILPSGSLSLYPSWLASVRPLAQARLEEWLESWCLRCAGLARWLGGWECWGGEVGGFSLGIPSRRTVG